jgi:hypothetical protein
MVSDPPRIWKRPVDDSVVERNLKNIARGYGHGRTLTKQSIRTGESTAHSLARRVLDAPEITR